MVAGVVSDSVGCGVGAVIVVDVVGRSVVATAPVVGVTLRHGRRPTVGTAVGTPVDPVVGTVVGEAVTLEVGVGVVASSAPCDANAIPAEPSTRAAAVAPVTMMSLLRFMVSSLLDAMTFPRRC